jgi:hypothetical protein
MGTHKLITVEEVVTRDASSGRLHIRLLREDGKLFTQEGCNLDQAGGYTILTAEELIAAIERAEPGMLCENDWPVG